jgi:hypothetical protein
MEDRRGPLNRVVTKAPLSKKWLESEGLDLADLDKNDDKRAFLYLGKSRALKDAAKKGVSGWKNEPWAPLPLALFEQTDTLTKTANNPLPSFCERQGRCFLGCMPGARHTLNKMMIAKILSKFPNVSLENYADVSHVEFVDQGTYKVWLKDAKDSQKAAGCRVASKVIVSAGTLGSTEILLRSREGYQGKNFTGNLRLSNRLGHQFSSNGDFGGFTVPKNGADPSVAQSLLPYPVFPTKGPINTSHVMFLKGDMQINIEDAAIPAMFAPLVRTALNVLGSTPSSGSGKKQVFEFFGIMNKLWRSGKFSNTDKKPWDDPFAPLFPGIRRSGIFTLTDGETITRNLTLFRQPGKWAASFDAWDQLPNQHQPLKKVLDKSSAVKVKGGETLGKFTQAAYDNVSNPTTINAKAALLNLYAKLTEMIEPAGEAEPWFSFVREIVEIGRERFIAVVDQRMEQLVRTISNDIGQFPEYKKTPAQNHFGNFPAAFNIVKSKMVSIKSREDHGNVQLTLAQGKDATGNDTFLLDADIDENGKLMAHLADLFKHKFNGGTHPFDIHEFLVLSSPNRPLGYTLV